MGAKMGEKKFERCEKESFAVIGKEGSSLDGAGFIQKLWDDAEATDGWTKWIIPGYEYIYVECEEEGTFAKTIKYLEENDIPLVGAVHDFVCPQTGKNYMFFPVRKL